MPHPLIGMPQGAEWLVILAIVILVFGAAKLPELARGTGQALRIFKSETKGLKDEESTDTADRGTTTPEQRELEARNRAGDPADPADSDQVVRERRDDTTA